MEKMKVSAFTFIKNGQILGYPFLQSIQSILTIVDEFIINVGESEDDTLMMIQSLASPKIRIIESQWNEFNARSRLCLWPAKNDCTVQLYW